MKNFVPTFKKWQSYQEERFPLLKYSLITAAFAGSGLALSSMTSTPGEPFPFRVFPAAFLVSLSFFFQLRVSDEIKDYETDCRYYPKRPVPRGLVTRNELVVIAMILAALQILLCLQIGLVHLLPLFACWTYLLFMHNEFFIGEWLKKHPLIYTFLHMLVLLCLDVFITSCHWLDAGLLPSPTLISFYATSFFLGLVLEIGRKVKSPQEDFSSSNTYTNMLGENGAISLWYAAIIFCFGFATLTAMQTSDMLMFLSFIFPSLSLCFLSGAFFLFHKNASTAKRIESAAGLFVLCTYLSLGLVPFIVQKLGS